MFHHISNLDTVDNFKQYCMCYIQQNIVQKMRRNIINAKQNLILLSEKVT